jgi:dTDP-4-dehydrorhamnose reductase
MIWVTGCRGMLGTELVLGFEQWRVDFVGSDRDVDITDEAAISDFVSRHEVDCIVNCAGYTAVDQAEDEPVAARAVNALAPAALARVARDLHARFFQISTDYVFDGSALSPYDEGSLRSPLGVYGRTKAEGEELALLENPLTTVIRTAWLYGAHGRNFVHTMLGLMRQRDSIRVVADQRGTPTWSRNLADFIRALMSGSEPGIYHYTDSGEASWYEFAMAIRDEALSAGLLHAKCTIMPIRTAEHPAKAKRPAYSVLSKNKIEKLFGIVPPPWRESLRRYLRRDGFTAVSDATDTGRT